MSPILLRAALAAFLALAAAPMTAAPGDNWPRFLGPDGIAVGHDADLPESWSLTENIEWAAAVPGTGWSSPIVWGDRVFVTAATSEQPMKQPSYGVDFSNEYIAELQAQGLSIDEINAKSDERDAEFPDEVVISLMLYCLDLQSGEIVWERELRHGRPAVGRHRKNSYTSETPVTDGEAVYVYIAHTGLWAFDLEGNELWSTALQPYKVYFEFGGGTSPVLHDDRIYILNDNEEASFVAAFDKHTGEQLWRTERPGLGRQRHSSWSSPIVWDNALRTELVTQGPLTAISYDLDGNELWRMGNMGASPISTPLAWDGLLYLVSGPPGGQFRPIAAVRPGASGDITLPQGATHSDEVVWYDRVGAPYLSTPVIYDGAMYVLQDKGIFTKYDARTGEVVYRARIAPGAAHFTASPWAYNGKVFCLAEEGDTYVIGTGDSYELLGVNSLGEFSMATPAIVGDRLLLRTQQHLFSIRAQ
ncbi:MAG: PQQ-binding-like beta-propeller repeat protein [Acidobacteriota bacterium]|jgi:outer membrane protein assembly factor BamB